MGNSVLVWLFLFFGNSDNKYNNKKNNRLFFLLLAALDECSNYKVLDGADRAQDNAAQNNVRCDQRDLQVGWYRFQGDAGDKMPEQCVPQKRCGTHAPGWLQGAHPSVAEGVVERKVCYHWSSNCCHWSNNIKVRNCGGFFVYELQKTPVCSLRYCGNAQGTSRPKFTTPFICLLPTRIIFQNSKVFLISSITRDNKTTANYTSNYTTT